MDFFSRQNDARRQTRRMLVLFAIAVIAIVGFIDAAVYLALRANGNTASPPALLGGLSIAVVAVIGFGSLYRTATLSDGGSAVARSLGATEVPATTTEFAYRRLRNVVEELSIASGVAMPEVFVLEEEAGINAFASGYTPADAAITVTRGALDKLTREELQGVIGHEFSHVLNGDMRLNIRLMGIVFGILVIATIGRKIIWAASRGRGSRKGGGQIILVGAALFVAGYVGVLFGRMIKASISRQREFLADASAVQFTRQTEGIAGSLKKIGGLAEGSRLEAGNREEVAHMLFGDGIGYSALFATHPPLQERIRRLDPSFDPSELAAIAEAWSNPVHLGEEAGENASISGFAPAQQAVRAGRAPARMDLPAADATLRVSAAGVARQVGNPGSNDRRVAHAIRARLPTALREAARQREYAMPLVFALLLDSSPNVRGAQLDAIERHYEPGTRADVETLAASRKELHPMHRLPLVALALPALRRRPRPQLSRFMAVVEELIRTDGQVSVEEYCLARLIRVQVIDALDPAGARGAGRVKLPQVEAQVSALLAIVASHGHSDRSAAARAYVAGMREVLPDSVRVYAPPGDWLAILDAAMTRLDHLVPAGKEMLVRGLTRAISDDGTVTVAEAELLRTLCAALHCPLPPLLQDPVAA
jgi:Zn-dependent protease with chaperone function